MALPKRLMSNYDREIVEKRISRIKNQVSKRSTAFAMAKLVGKEISDSYSLGDWSVSYVDDDPFTLCTIYWKDRAVGIGAAKRMTYAKSADAPDPVRGQNIALSRAVDVMVAQWNRN